MVKYSYRALRMKYVEGSWIELCNNDCGTLVYFDKDSNIVRNATLESNDCVHKDVCDFLKDLKKGARAFNWYPSFAIETALVNVFISADKAAMEYTTLMTRIAELKRAMQTQWDLNKQAKLDWEKEKSTKLQVKKDSARAYQREQEQKRQWIQYGEKVTQPPQFTTADRLQYRK